MEFDLLSYRFGALASLFPEAAASLTLPAKANLLSTFRQQQKQIQFSQGFERARRLIEKEARTSLDKHLVYYPGANARAEARFEPPDVVTVPPPFGKRRQRPASHLAAVFPRDRLTLQMGKSKIALRIRASVTACALEVTGGFPKLWWTFEAVPENPQEGVSLSLHHAVRLLKFARGLEDKLLSELKDVYFESLATVTDGDSEALKGELLDRLRIRCVDSNDEAVSALIEALRFRVKSAAELRESDGQSLKVAKRGLTSFETFINTTNDERASPIDPNGAEAETRLFGVEGITARNFDYAEHDVSIAAIAQTPVEPTPYDRLASVRERRLAERSEARLLEVSPARRLSAELANDAAQELDDYRHALRQSILAPVPA